MFKLSDSIFIRDISLSRDKYLNSHRFASTPYFPFVMGMEFFCQVCNDITLEYESILFSDFRIHNPLMFRRDRDKRVEIHVEHGNGFDNIEIKDEVTKYISGKLAARAVPRREGRVAFPQEQITKQKGNILDTDFLYPEIFPHGPHFQNQYELYLFNESEMIVRQFGFNNSLEYIAHEKIEQLTCNPALLDGILQMCSYYSVLDSKCFLLPISTGACFIKHSIKDQLDDVTLRIVKNSPIRFDVFVFCNKTEEIVIEFKDVTFAPLKKKFN